jgi:hypothetical protein
MDEDGVVDVMVLNDANLENVTYVTSSAVGTWSSPTLAYFGAVAGHLLGDWRKVRAPKDRVVDNVDQPRG